ASDPALSELWRRIIVVEKPVHRDRALSDDPGTALRGWPDRPRLIIDESDGAVGDLPRALALGYAGTSHKNCKGSVKGIANACLRIREGRVALSSVNAAPLGVAPLFDPSRFERQPMP